MCGVVGSGCTGSGAAARGGASFQEGDGGGGAAPAAAGAESEINMSIECRSRPGPSTVAARAAAGRHSGDNGGVRGGTAARSERARRACPRPLSPARAALTPPRPAGRPAAAAHWPPLMPAGAARARIGRRRGGGGAAGCRVIGPITAGAGNVRPNWRRVVIERGATSLGHGR